MRELRVYIRWAGIALLAVPLGWGTALAGTAAAPGATSVIVQTTNAAILNWNNFVVPAGSTINFIQPTGVIALNRVTGGPASTVYGTLTAAGHIFVINPTGVAAHTGPISAAGSIPRSAPPTPSSNIAQTAIAIRTPHAPIEDLSVPAAGPGEFGITVADAESGNTARTSRPLAFEVAGDDLLVFATSSQVEQRASRNVQRIASIDQNSVSLPMRMKRVLDHVINTCGIVEATSAAIIDGQVVLSGHGDACR